MFIKSINVHCQATGIAQMLYPKPQPKTDTLVNAPLRFLIFSSQSLCCFNHSYVNK